MDEGVEEQEKKKGEVTFVTMNIEQTSGNTDNEELDIWSIIENTIRERLDRLRIESKPEREVVVTMCEDQEQDEESEKDRTI